MYISCEVGDWGGYIKRCGFYWRLLGSLEKKTGFWRTLIVYVLEILDTNQIILSIRCTTDMKSIYRNSNSSTDGQYLQWDKHTSFRLYGS